MTILPCRVSLNKRIDFLFKNHVCNKSDKNVYKNGVVQAEFFILIPIQVILLSFLIITYFVIAITLFYNIQKSKIIQRLHFTNVNTVLVWCILDTMVFLKPKHRNKSMYYKRKSKMGSDKMGIE